MRKHGIYQIMNKSNGKIYIGSSKDIDKRWKQHIRNLNNDNHCNQYLQNAWNKYGKDGFTFTILEECSLLLEAEQRWLEEKFPFEENGYNICKHAGRPNGFKGRKHSKASRRKISEANIGKSLSDEAKKAISIAAKERYESNIHPWVGRNHSETSKLKMSESHKGATATPEARKKMSEARSGKKHYNFGKNLSDEQKAKISLNHADVSNENNPMYGKKHKNSTKDKISKANKSRFVGEKSVNAKLTWDNVQTIRELYSTKLYTQQQLGEMFNVSRITIGEVVRHKTWKQI